jgi:hypothetical protein
MLRAGRRAERPGASHDPPRIERRSSRLVVLEAVRDLSATAEACGSGHRNPWGHRWGHDLAQLTDLAGLTHGGMRAPASFHRSEWARLDSNQGPSDHESEPGRSMKPRRRNAPAADGTGSRNRRRHANARRCRPSRARICAAINRLRASKPVRQGLPRSPGRARPRQAALQRAVPPTAPCSPRQRKR